MAFLGTTFSRFHVAIKRAIETTLQVNGENRQEKIYFFSFLSVFGTVLTFCAQCTSLLHRKIINTPWYFSVVIGFQCVRYTKYIYNFLLIFVSLMAGRSIRFSLCVAYGNRIYGIMVTMFTSNYTNEHRHRKTCFQHVIWHKFPSRCFLFLSPVISKGNTFPVLHFIVWTSHHAFLASVRHLRS